MDNKSGVENGEPVHVSPKVRLRRKDRDQHAYNRHSFIVESNGGGLNPDSVTHLYNPYSKKHVSTTSLAGGGVFPRCGVPAKVMRSDLDRDTFLNNRRSMDLSDLEKLRFQSSTYNHDSNNFWKSFGKAMVFVQLAVKSLDGLNEQLMQYIFSPKSTEDNDELSPKDRETLKSSIVLMRELLMDAQNKFSKLVDDNKRLTSKIDSAVLAANEEVNSLRAELFDTNRKLSGISECPTPEEFPKKTFMDNGLAVQHKISQDAEEIRFLNSENKRLIADLARLRQELVELKESNKSLIASDDGKANEIKLDFIQTKQELNRGREALTAMKADRKRLKAEKIDLLHQMKQLYCTLEDKESELRDFIRNYEQKMTESDDSIKQLAAEKEECEREKWEILKKAKQSTERAFSLKTELDQKDESIRKISSELTEAYDMLRQLGHLKAVSSASEDSVLKPPSLDGHQSLDSPDELPPYEANPESPEPASVRSSFRSSISQIPASSTPNRSTFSTPNLHVPSPGSHASSVENLQQSLNNEGIYVTIASDTNINRSESSQSLNRKKKKSSASFSRLFGGRSRSRKSVIISEPERLHVSGNPRMSALTPDNYQEKLSILDEAKHCTMSAWKAGHVLAWMEVEMNMPMYAKTCLENIKSGKVLLGLSDAELDSALSLTSPLHRRKLRLAIEEFRDPTIVKYAKAPRMDHTWIAHRWMVDLGLPQYRSDFDAQLLDGRILNVLTRKDLEKHLTVHRKFHQASILHGIELLRRVNFDKEVLAERRSRCEDQDCDPLVWTSARVTKWVNSIDLQEYAHNLRESGVHGAVLVLEPTFDAGALATALGIPPSKSYVRRHLSTELDTIIRPARLALEVSNGPKRRPHTAGGSVGSSFARSYRGGNSDSDQNRGSGRKISFRGSLGRALGRKTKDKLLVSQDSANT